MPHLQRMLLRPRFITPRIQGVQTRSCWKTRNAKIPERLDTMEDKLDSISAGVKYLKDELDVDKMGEKLEATVRSYLMGLVVVATGLTTVVTYAALNLR